MIENNANVTEKKEFIAPTLTVHGDVEIITQGKATGSRLDRQFPAGTPFGQLTFS